MEDSKEQNNQNGTGLRKQVREQILGYVIASFGLVAGLAWNDAIRAFIDFVFPLSKNSVFAKFFYAIVMTVLVVVITTYLIRLIRDRDKI